MGGSPAPPRGCPLPRRPPVASPAPPTGTDPRGHGGGTPAPGPEEGAARRGRRGTWYGPRRARAAGSEVSRPRSSGSQGVEECCYRGASAVAGFERAGGGALVSAPAGPGGVWLAPGPGLPRGLRAGRPAARCRSVTGGGRTAAPRGRSPRGRAAGDARSFGRSQVRDRGATRAPAVSPLHPVGRPFLGGPEWTLPRGLGGTGVPDGRARPLPRGARPSCPPRSSCHRPRRAPGAWAPAGPAARSAAGDPCLLPPPCHRPLQPRCLSPLLPRGGGLAGGKSPGFDTGLTQTPGPASVGSVNHSESQFAVCKVGEYMLFLM